MFLKLTYQHTQPF